jgi:cyclic pyranopterin monophosphate synthase
MSFDPNLRMVDVGQKAITSRSATAKGQIVMKPSTYKAVISAQLPKGDALAAAKLAGIMAAKQTPQLIPMCHPLLIEDVIIEYNPDKKVSTIEIVATVKGSGKTGYEMEALTAVTISLLTIYDMCKSLDITLIIENVRLAKKSGGKSGTLILE